MATREQMTDSIEHGSTPYGERGPMEDSISSGLGASPPPGAGGGGPMAQPQPNVAPVGGSPMDLLLSGDYPNDPSLPLTDGLGVGPGAGPLEPEGPPVPPLVERFRMVAQHAKSPTLRAEARAALKILYERGVY